MQPLQSAGSQSKEEPARAKLQSDVSQHRSYSLQLIAFFCINTAPPTERQTDRQTHIVEAGSEEDAEARIDQRRSFFLLGDLSQALCEFSLAAATPVWGPNEFLALNNQLKQVPFSLVRILCSFNCTNIPLISWCYIPRQCMNECNNISSGIHLKRRELPMPQCFCRYPCFLRKKSIRFLNSRHDQGNIRGLVISVKHLNEAQARGVGFA